MKEKLDQLRPDWAATLPRAYVERLLTLHAWGVLSVDGLYFLEIERRYGTQVATDIDTAVWEAYGTMEAERIKAAMAMEGGHLDDVARALEVSSWLFYIPDFGFEMSEDGRRMTLLVRDCRIQRKRLRKGLGEFPCKEVGLAYLRNFVKVFDENIVVSCDFCPPDRHPDDEWCRWEFEVR